MILANKTCWTKQWSKDMRCYYVQSGFICILCNLHLMLYILPFPERHKISLSLLIKLFSWLWPRKTKIFPVLVTQSVNHSSVLVEASPSPNSFSSIAMDLDFVNKNTNRWRSYTANVLNYVHKTKKSSMSCRNDLRLCQIILKPGSFSISIVYPIVQRKERS